MLLLRFAVVTPGILFTLAWSFVGDAVFRRTHEWIMGAAVTWMIGGIALMAATVPYPALHNIDQAMGGMLLIIAGGGTITGLRFLPTVLATLPIIAAVLVMIASFYPDSLVTTALWLSIGAALAAVASYLLDSRARRAWLATRELARERERSEQLLRNVLPEAIAERLKREPGRIAEHFPAATVLFADLVGFTPLAGRVPPETLVATLDDIFSRFDALTERHGLEKIKTIGDSYMAVGGVPTPRPDHARAVAEMALAMRAVVAQHPTLDGQRLALRIGIATGPVVAGVIGKRKLVYDLWGDTVNLASRMESHGVEDGIQITETTRALLCDEYALEPRGAVPVKGKGAMPTWLLLGPRPG
jgi:class 3 adenylate cyclase